MTVSPVGPPAEFRGRKTMVRIQVQSRVNVEDQIIHSSLLQQVELECVCVRVCARAFLKCHFIQQLKEILTRKWRKTEALLSVILKKPLFLLG